MMRRRAWWTVAVAALLAAACQRGGSSSGERSGGGPAPEERTTGRAADTGGDERQSSARAGATGAVQEIQGTIAQASADQVVVKPSDGKPATLKVNPGTAISVDGRAVTPEELPQGAQVRAAFEPSGEGGTAVRIEATRGRGQGRMSHGSDMQEGPFGQGYTGGAHGGQGASPTDPYRGTGTGTSSEKRK